ncbi:HD domain-containing protein [Desmospora profundinema]|uniref:HD superfamily phosphohydrolase n=1 Tax=Desmospora profundinema TaxID=1571184 RepID=A0ABU1IJ92_9BACL|nr:HD domain-containing protein [Desmospora profundinema]MDR6224751.1 HD superfamily phosphohydrolase [Desmospora profundinema]
MRLVDPLYGSVEIEPVLAELFQTPPVRRLAGVHQAGAASLMRPQWNVTRLEHSAGVLLLIRRLGGSLQEQAAGLLHDVSHTAFSHLVDRVLDHPAEDYHDQQWDEIVKAPSIAAAIAGAGWEWDDLLPLKRWSILEQPAPDMCADRVDYTLRDQHRYFGLSLEEIHAFLDALTLVDGRMAVKSVEWAEWFVDAYYREVVDFFLDPDNVYAHERLSGVLQGAIREGAVTDRDWMKTDRDLLETVQTRGSEALLCRLSEIRPGVRLEECGPDENWDIHLKQKVRWIDPLVMEGDGPVMRASQRSAFIWERTSKAKERMEKGVYVRIL